MRITKKYYSIGLGGTFDHFHTGHEKFILFAAEHGQELKIGITDSKMTMHKKLNKTIQPYQHRVKAVKKFCQNHNLKFDIFQLVDIYGPTLERGQVKSLCVTAETTAGAEKINEARIASGLRELPTFICEMFNNSSGKSLHSEDIRAGVVNRAGKVYLDSFPNGITLTDKQREQLRTPLGKIVTFPSDKTGPIPFTAVVGDQSLANFLRDDWKFNLAIFDGKIQNEAHDIEAINEVKPDLNVTNPNGQITTDLISGIKTALDKSLQFIKVEGEEDLAAAALILSLPLFSRLYYGQPDQGMVEVTVDEKVKERVFKILRSAS